MLKSARPERHRAATVVADVARPAGQLDIHRVEALEKELKSLREAVDKLNETLKAGKGPKRD